MKEWYYYLHTNGDIISKNPVVVTDGSYFDSPFVKKVWRLDLEDRGTCWKMILEALSLGGRIERVKELSSKWGLTYKDSIEMITRIKPSDLERKGIELFIKNILNMEVEDYWNKIKLLGEQKEKAR